MKQTFGILLLALTLFSTQAKADMYVGGLVGYGFESGTGVDTQGGLALGATAGLQLVPNLGVAATFLHNSETYTGYANSVSQYLLEANFFSVLFFPSGVHIGQVHTNINNGGFTSNDLGYGLHTGVDIQLMSNVTIGAAAYWTYVTTTNDHHSVFDVVVPIKFHFY